MLCFYFCCLCDHKCFHGRAAAEGHLCEGCGGVAAEGAPVGSFDALLLIFAVRTQLRIDALLLIFAVRTQLRICCAYTTSLYLRWSDIWPPALAAGAFGVGVVSHLLAAGTCPSPGCICICLPNPVPLTSGCQGSLLLGAGTG